MTRIEFPTFLFSGAPAAEAEASALSAKRFCKVRDPGVQEERIIHRGGGEGDLSGGEMKEASFPRTGPRDKTAECVTLLGKEGPGSGGGRMGSVQLRFRVWKFSLVDGRTGGDSKIYKKEVFR